MQAFARQDINEFNKIRTQKKSASKGADFSVLNSLIILSEFEKLHSFYNFGERASSLRVSFTLSLLAE
jgi:hypothetical protein